VSSKVVVENCSSIRSYFRKSDSKLSSSSSSEESSDKESEEEAQKINEKSQNEKQLLAKPEVSKPKSNLDLLLDLSDLGSSIPVMTPSLGGFSNT
jgi:hypothetical protein